MHIRRGLPLTSAEHEPHFPALQSPSDREIVGLFSLDLMHRVEHDHAIRHAGRVIQNFPPVASPRQIRNVAVVGITVPLDYPSTLLSLFFPVSTSSPR
jgi:hypothetical protein